MLMFGDTCYHFWEETPVDNQQLIRNWKWQQKQWDIHLPLIYLQVFKPHLPVKVEQCQSKHPYEVIDSTKNFQTFELGASETGGACHRPKHETSTIKKLYYKQY